MRARAALMACAALMLLLGASPRAQADADKVRLIYERERGTERCPVEPYLHQEVARRLGHDPFTNEDASKTVTVTMTRRGGYYQGAAQLTDADGKRLWEQDPPLYDPDCELVVSSVALSLVVALTPLQASPEPSQAPRAPPPAPPAPPPTPAPSCPAPAPPPAVLPSEAPPRPAPAPSRPPRVQFGAGAFGTFLRTPAPGLGVFISAGLRWPYLSIMFDGRAQLPIVASELQSAVGSVRDVRATLATGSLAPCIHPGAMFLCVPVELGVRSVTAAGSNIDKANSPFVSVGLRTGIEWPLNQGLLLRGYTDIGATLLAGDVTVEREVAWTFPPVSIVLSAALIASFDVAPSTTRLSTTRQTAYRIWP